MAESSSFMSGKLRIPETAKPAVEKPAPKTKPQESKSQPEKPWVGQASIRELEKRNAERSYIRPEQPTVPEVPKVDKVPQVPNETRQTKNTKPAEDSPIAPVKDFHRVSNSINREALEGGMFTRPSCKQVYDALYLLTRGAIQPSRTVQIGRKQLQKKAGIGSDKTLDAAVISLQAVGLLKVDVAFGSQKGNVYEVLMPEEITVGTIGTLGTSGTDSTIGQKVPNVPEVFSTYGTEGQTIENTEIYQNSKTSFNTNTKNDDDSVRINSVYSGMIKRLDVAAKKLTGKTPSKHESDKWEALADLLVLELEVAAARAGGVSSVPAFLTEVLRRQFFAARQQQKVVAKTSKAKPDTVGKSESESFEIKALDEQGRELALEELKEFAGESFLDDFRKWYTDEDWQWLTEKLKIVNR